MEIRDKILIVEDDSNIAGFISTVLETNGYNSLVATNGTEAISMITSHCPDLVILDLTLPDIDGMEILSRLRSWSSMPVIIVSARGRERDKVYALDQGADDYITKPFGSGELLARIRTALRHTRNSGTSDLALTGVFRLDQLVVDFNKHKVFVNGVNARLTQSEYRILSMLARHAGKVLTYDYILKELWGPSAGNNNQILRVNMANIRRKIEKNPAEPQYIFTEIGVGYRMAEPN